MARIDLHFPTPYLNASGFLGMMPPTRWNFSAPQGIFVTPPFSRSARTPADHRCLLPFPGGYLLHSGLPNPGLRAALKKHTAAWSRSHLPIWVHLIPNTPDEMGEMVQALESVDNIAALEVGLEFIAGTPRLLPPLCRSSLPHRVNSPWWPRSLSTPFQAKFWLRWQPPVSPPSR